MIDWMSDGGIFMVPMTVLGLLMILIAGRVLYGAYSQDGSRRLHKLNFIVLQLGIFIFFLGILSHVLGLVQVLGVLEEVSGVSPNLIAGGLRVAFIAPTYGLILFLIGLGAWSVAKYRTAE